MAFEDIYTEVETNPDSSFRVRASTLTPVIKGQVNNGIGKDTYMHEDELENELNKESFYKMTIGHNSHIKNLI